MKLIILFSTMLVVVLAGHLDSATRKARYEEYLKKHSKTYSEGEKKLRETIFHMNMDSHHKHNEKHARGEVTYKVGPNKFTDMTHEERQRHFGIKIDPQHKHSNRSKRAASSFNQFGWLPASLDYRKSGWNESVRDQGHCGSCWAFSSSTVMSYYAFKKLGKTFTFSPQNLVDCASYYGNNGCEGGQPNGGFEYIKANKHALDSAYPYTGENGLCYKSSLRSNVFFGFSSYIQVPSDESSFMQALARYGPILVAIDASYLQEYTEGVWDGSDSQSGSPCDSNAVNHAVVLIGYGHDSSTGQDYWLIKNSWSASWGESGYFRMVRGAQNHCGLYLHGYTITD